MSETSSSFSDEIHAKPQRPLGVWLLTIYGAIFAGIVPLGATIFILTSEEALAVLGTGIEYYLGIALSLSALIFSFRTWQGRNRARVIFLIIITLHYGFLALNNYQLLNSGMDFSGAESRMWGRVFRGLLYPAIYIWYFMRASTRDFFRD